MAIRLPKGAKEYLNVLVSDATGTITTLDGTSPHFDVADDLGSTTGLYSNQAAINSGMLVQCLVDTGLAGFVVGSHYNLYVEFTIGVEAPRLGPFDIFIT